MNKPFAALSATVLAFAVFTGCTDTKTEPTAPVPPTSSVDPDTKPTRNDLPDVSTFGAGWTAGNTENLPLGLVNLCESELAAGVGQADQVASYVYNTTTVNVQRIKVADGVNVDEKITELTSTCITDDSVEGFIRTVIVNDPVEHPDASGIHLNSVGIDGGFGSGSGSLAYARLGDFVYFVYATDTSGLYEVGPFGGLDAFAYDFLNKILTYSAGGELNFVPGPDVSDSLTSRYAEDENVVEDDPGIGITVE